MSTSDRLLTPDVYKRPMCTNDRFSMCVSHFDPVASMGQRSLMLFGMWWGLWFLPRHPFQGIAGKSWVFKQAIGRPCRSWSSLEATFPGKFVVCQHMPTYANTMLCMLLCLEQPWTTLNVSLCSCLGGFRTFLAGTAVFGRSAVCWRQRCEITGPRFDQQFSHHALIFPIGMAWLCPVCSTFFCRSTLECGTGDTKTQSLQNPLELGMACCLYN